MYSGVADAEYDGWSEEANYRKYGWLYTVCIQFHKLQIAEPADYSESRVKQLLEQAEEGYNNALLDEKTVPKNLIVIMNESLADFSDFEGVNTNQEVLPYIHSLGKEDNVQKGFVSVHTIAGGTCNTEWEFLTGTNIQMMENESWPYQMFYTNGKSAYTTEGITKSLKEAGYRTIAMHPNEASNWNRDVVYPLMLFDEYLDIADYEGYHKLRGYISDKGNYAKIVDYYEQHTGEPLFIFNITMQNHGGYLGNEGIDNQINLLDYEDLEVENYLSSIHESDIAFEELLNYFSSVEENTMIVMFGDHFPQLADEFYRYAYGNIERIPGDKERMFVTPYIIWTNYEREYEEIPVMSIHYLSTYVKQEMGMELTDYEKYQLDFMEQYPVVGKYGIADQKHHFTIYDELTGEQQKLLREFKAVQYYHMKYQ